MPSSKKAKNSAKNAERLKRDRVGDLFAVVRSETGEGSLRISFRRNWYSPPYTDEGAVDYEAAAEELGDELEGGTVVLRNYLENGELGYAAEINVESKDELERVLRTIRKVYQEGLKQDNATRLAALEQCKVKIAEQQMEESLRAERRKDAERRKGDRRTRHRFGQALFRKRDRRIAEDRRGGRERRVSHV